MTYFNGYTITQTESGYNAAPASWRNPPQSAIISAKTEAGIKRMIDKLKTQRATLPTEYVSNGYNYSREKETVSSYTVTACKRGVLAELISARFYMARHSDGTSPVYCSVWIHNVCSGKGTASGYGYHKESAALSAALDSAKIKLSLPIDGHGETAMQDAFRAIAKAMGYNNIIITRN